MSVTLKVIVLKNIFVTPQVSYFFVNNKFVPVFQKEQTFVKAHIYFNLTQL